MSRAIPTDHRHPKRRLVSPLTVPAICMVLAYLVAANTVGRPFFQNPWTPNNAQYFGWPWIYAYSELTERQWEALQLPDGGLAKAYDEYVPPVLLNPSLLVYEFEPDALTKNIILGVFVLAYCGLTLELSQRRWGTKTFTIRHALAFTIFTTAGVWTICSGHVYYWWFHEVYSEDEMWLLFKGSVVVVAVAFLVYLLVDPVASTSTRRDVTRRGS